MANQPSQEPNRTNTLRRGTGPLGSHPIRIRRIFKDAAVAAALSTILALLLASLSAAGIVTMGTAIFEIACAFGIAAFLALLAPVGVLYRGALVALAGIVAFSLGWYEDRNYTPPLTKQDVVQAVEDGTVAHPFHSASQCPRGVLTLYMPVVRNVGSKPAGVGISVPHDSKACIVEANMSGVQKGIEERDAPKSH